MPSRFDLYEAGKDDTLDKAWFDRRFGDVDSRITILETFEAAYASTLAQAGDDVLQRSEATIAALRAQLLALTGLNWLVAGSSTSATLVPGQALTFAIAGADAPLFAPGPFVLLSRLANATDYAVAQLLKYDRPSGALSVRVLTTAGAPGPFTDWEIASMAGATVAQMMALTQGLQATASAATAAASTAADRTQTGLDRAATDADAAATAQDRAAVHADRQAADASATAAAAAAASVNAATINNRLTSLETSRTADESADAALAARVDALEAYDPWFLEG